jgi:hypothetical protein
LKEYKRINYRRSLRKQLRDINTCPIGQLNPEEKAEGLPIIIMAFSVPYILTPGIATLTVRNVE